MQILEPVWPPQCHAVLFTSVPAAMARTVLEFARPRSTISPARLLSVHVLLTLRLPGSAASPVMCRLAYPLVTMLLRHLGLDVVFVSIVTLPCSFA